MSHTLSEYRMLLQDLMAGNARPSKIIGRGYKNPKSSASGWLRREMHNITNPEQAISGCYVTSSGAPYSSIAKAKASLAYIRAAAGTMQFIRKDMHLEDFGVIPDPAGDKGFVVFTRTSTTGIL